MQSTKREWREKHFVTEWRTQEMFVKWLNGNPVEGHKTNLSALFLWYSNHL